MELNRKIVILLLIGTTVVFFIILSIVWHRRSSTQTTVIPTLTLQQPTRSPTVGQPSQEELLRGQSQSDKKFGDWQKKLYETYPWYDKLPLQSERYFVYFNPETKKFKAKLYPNATEPLYEQLNALKAEIRTKLQELGIPFKEEDIEWVVSTS